MQAEAGYNLSLAEATLKLEKRKLFENLKINNCELVLFDKIKLSYLIH